MAPLASRPTKYIFVTGGVVSALGKGIAAAALGALFEARGFRPTAIKFDPYLNVDPGTMSPFQHGETYVTDDGTEADLDLGHYERFLGTAMGRGNNITGGRMYLDVISAERRGDYLGATVQAIPHLTDYLKNGLREVAQGYEVVIAELGGTVGDIEGSIFLEAFRQFRHEYGKENVAFVHLALAPYIDAAGEMKTKPVQHSVRTLLGMGIQPDLVVVRTDRELEEAARKKIALFANVGPKDVIQAIDVPTVYEIPLRFREQDMDGNLCRRLGLPDVDPDMSAWQDVARKAVQPARGPVRIAIVGKYAAFEDSYKSVKEALVHGGIANDAKLELCWINSEELEREDAEMRAQNLARRYDAIVVPGGYGSRGVEGKIRAVQVAREQGIPFLGLCLGMQCAVIEYARNVCGLSRAHSEEFSAEAEHPVIHLMSEQEGVDEMGGTQRLGAYPVHFADGSLAKRLYAGGEASERHRHRYEVNNAYRDHLSKAGLHLSGLSPDERLVEFVELPDHPFFIATQAHPELKSRPIEAHPLFAGLVRAALQRQSEG